MYTVQGVVGCVVPPTGYLLVFHCLVHSSLGQASSMVEVARCDSLQETVRNTMVYKFYTDVH